MREKRLTTSSSSKSRPQQRTLPLAGTPQLLDFPQVRWWHAAWNHFIQGHRRRLHDWVPFTVFAGCRVDDLDVW
jgi:hypothetical protein